MSSQVDICNQALSKLSASRISSFSDNTIESNECAAVFDLVSEAVQSQGPWPSNKIRASLAQLADAPQFGFAYQYTLPTDPRCLRVLELNGALAQDIAFKIENGVLLTDEPSADILYIGLLTDTESFDPYLKASIVDHLIAQMAYKFTGQVAVAEKMEARAESNLHKNLALGSLQGSSDDYNSGTFTDVRNDG